MHPTLKNLGNTCYLNSALQLLFFSTQITNIIKSSTSTTSPLIKQLQLIVVNSYCCITFSPETLKKIIDTKYVQFQGNDQQDSHEFLSFLLQEIYIESPQIQHKFTFDETVITACNCGYNTSQLFINSQLLLHITINKEIQINSRFFDFSFIKEIHVPGNSIEELIDEYFKEQVSAQLCCECGSELTTKCVFQTVPEQLLIIIKRFAQGSKIQAQIEFGEELVLQGQKYLLNGVIMHAGSLNQGHYTCIGRIGGEWCEVSDERQYKIVMDFSDPRAYILSYSKVK